MTHRVLVAGAGIAGLTAALACARASAQVRLFERASAFGEVGAGIQIGPNVTRILHRWGLAQALSAVAAFPSQLQVRSAISGELLGALRLGATTRQKYGAPYATIHRADLHRLLLDALRQFDHVELRLDCAVSGFAQSAQQVSVFGPGGAAFDADVLLGADGLWSPVRQSLLGDGAPQPTGHLAYRALVRQSALPQALRSEHVTLWLGPGLHLVQYPVRGGEWLNVVGIVHGAVGASDAANGAPGDVANWSLRTDAAALRAELALTCARLQDLAQAIDHWRLWILCDRAPMRAGAEHARGRVALLGDAAHPMRPYLAQGAGMAMEDAAALGRVLTNDSDVPLALRAYADARWRRNARVQAAARRNGLIFHASGVLRWGRNAAMHLLGERLLDQPWLYRG